MASGQKRVYQGSFVATGSAVDIKVVGFRPTMVKCYTDQGIELGWTSEMADAAGLLRIANGTGSFISTNGITPLAAGFTFGASSANVNTHKVYFSAWD